MCDLLGGAVVLARCGTHSGPAAAVWTWSAAVVPRPCPCAAADRFVVAHESAAGRWLSAADVVVAAARDTAAGALRVAERLGRLPGGRLVFVPLAGGGAVLGGRVVVRRVCPVCVYPWHVRGGDLGALG